MPDPSEVSLIRRCQEGREDAFRELMEKYQRRVYWIAHNMLSNYDTAREISQEAFIRVFRNIARFDVKKNFYTWLYQITVNLCIDRMRKLSHGKTVDIDGLGGRPDRSPTRPAASGQRTQSRFRAMREVKGVETGDGTDVGARPRIGTASALSPTLGPCRRIEFCYHWRRC